MTMELLIRPAIREDVPLVLAFIRDLAEYERLSHEVTATEQDLADTLFGSRPGAEVLLGFTAGEPAAFALFFPNYSTFLGKPGIYLEDLFVRPAWRGRGFGKAMLSAVARTAVERGCGRLEWSCLDWNEPSIGFYKSLGAQAMDEWTVYRLTGSTLRSFAGAE